MRDGKTARTNEGLSSGAVAKHQDGGAATSDVTLVNYDHVLFGLLDGASTCMVDRVVRLYPDLPGRRSMSEAEALLRRASTSMHRKILL